MHTCLWLGSLGRQLNVLPVLPDQDPLSTNFPLDFTPQFLLYLPILIPGTKDYTIGTRVHFDTRRQYFAEVEVDV